MTAQHRNGFTVTQQRIINVLSDGMRHSKQELIAAIDEDGLTTYGTLAVHICHIRKHLRPRGQDILCEWWERKRWYRQVQLLASPYDGRS